MSILDPIVFPKISCLSNGLKVATIPIKSELSTIGIWVKSGSIYENPKTSGVAHFLEHILFRGNEKYPQKQLEMLAEAKGINLMAATSRVTTAFFAQVDQQQVSQATDVLSQIVLNPKIEQSAVDNERATILAEEFEVNHDFNETVWDRLHKACFPESSVGMPILGTRETIQSISAEMIKSHHDKFFNQSNCYFIAATKEPHEKIVEYVGKATAFLKPRATLDINGEDNKVKPVFKPQFLLFNSNYIQDSWCSLAIEAPHINSPFFIPCQLIKNGIGDLNYRLPMERPSLLRSTAVNRLQTHYFPYGTSGILAFLGNAPFGREQEWMNDIIRSVQSITAELTPETLQLAKKRLKYQLARNLTSTRAVADELGMNLLLRGRWRSLENWGHEIDSVSKDDMMNFAMTFLHKKPFAGSFVLPPPPPQATPPAAKEQAPQPQKPTAQKNQPSKIINPNEPLQNRPTKLITK